jgi:hypothetical protein
MFGLADDTHSVAMRRLAVVGRQRRGGGSPGGRPRSKQAKAARAITAAVAASSAAGPAGVVEVAAHLHRTQFRPLRADLHVLPPGPALSGLLDRLDSERAGLTEHTLVDVISGWARQTAYAEAAQIRAIAELAGRAMFAGCTEHGHGDPAHGIRGAASVVSAELRLSPSAAVARTTLAVELVQELPATLAELAAGRIDGYRARVIAEQTRPLADSPTVRRDVEAALLRRAPRQTATQLRAAAGRAVAAADPASAEERHRRARPAGSCPRRVRNPAAWPACTSACPPKTPPPCSPPSTPPPATSKPPPQQQQPAAAAVVTMMGGRWTSCARTCWPGWAGPPSRPGIWAAATPTAATCISRWVPAAGRRRR